MLARNGASPGRQLQENEADLVLDTGTLVRAAEDQRTARQFSARYIERVPRLPRQSSRGLQAPLHQPPHAEGRTRDSASRATGSLNQSHSWSCPRGGDSDPAEQPTCASEAGGSFFQVAHRTGRVLRGLGRPYLSLSNHFRPPRRTGATRAVPSVRPATLLALPLRAGNGHTGGDALPPTPAGGTGSARSARPCATAASSRRQPGLSIPCVGGALPALASGGRCRPRGHSSRIAHA